MKACGHWGLFPWHYLNLLLLAYIARYFGDGYPLQEGELLGEIIIPAWVSQQWTEPATATDRQKRYPARGEITVTVDGKELVLEVEQNSELLAKGYTETHYTKDGTPVTSQPNHTDHCHYHGHVKKYRESWVALSTCSGFRGLIVLENETSYYIKPLGSSVSKHHTIHKTTNMPVINGTCGHESHSLDNMSDFTKMIQSVHSRIKRNTWTTQKYMELFIVADNALYRKQQQNLGQTKQRILEIANYVDKFYRSVNIKVALIGQEVWTEKDQSQVSDDPNATLWAFMKWKQKLKFRKKHDNAQLLTGVVFKGTTIGMAPLEGMCTQDNSGGVSVDHSELPIGAAATMAHEIGHNFGMSHDAEGCCTEAKPDDGGCIMAAATGHPFPRVFSKCSKNELLTYFQKGGGMCLFDMPNTDDLVAGKKCGNGFVEENEECDCGEVEECTNPCCNANNCTLKAGAQCAHGDCCSNCQLKNAGSVCRPPAGSCDLPEYCTGTSPYCPANVYIHDGSTCANGAAYCYNGMCLTHQQQCVQLWGPGARPAPDACFEDVNAAGNAYGNCGKDSLGNYIRCEKRDAKCGKIQCQSAATKPKGTNTVSIDTTIRLEGREVKCRGTFVYTKHEEEKDLPDPGLVIAGTKCGAGMVCKERRCQNASFTELYECIARCHDNGVCNSNKNCHCNRGWAPPFCNKPGLGGSVDSGPIQPDSQVGLVVGLLFAFLVILPALFVAVFCCYKKETSLFNTWIKKRKESVETSRNRKLDKKVYKGQPDAAVPLKSITPSETGNRINKPGKEASANGYQPVNIVRPLRPAPIHNSQSQGMRELKPLRPAPPIGKSPMLPGKKESHPPTGSSPTFLTKKEVPVKKPIPPASKPFVFPVKSEDDAMKPIPPRKPLPIQPAKNIPAVFTTPVKETPPVKPLPLKPAHTKAGALTSNNSLLVTMPTVKAKSAVSNPVLQSGKPLKPLPTNKPQATSFPFRK
ncbi:disintegrin and metalloproteinase domain-containing protein 33-like [Protopterus annectens]|uniref:disintegrin and metalloproteinase domain-containing protein 33-like n=1 Tax=Protopterus annectens TaxID=7888 RepID=UPI001CFBC0B5|nr:disintegrin and metalloproteinase domain-containing protein 33-like [Protopterus annectens]